MAYEGFECLRVQVDRGVAFVTLDHPPINLFDLPLMRDIDRLGQEIERDDAVRVAVFQSANPDFFIAHADVELIQRLPAQPPPKSDKLGYFHTMVDRFRTMPKVTIAKREGRARGGGSEFALSLDMRFAAIGRAILSQPEVALGIIPGGSGTQRLPRLMGRARWRSSPAAKTSRRSWPSATATSTARCRRRSWARSSMASPIASRRSRRTLSRSRRRP